MALCPPLQASAATYTVTISVAAGADNMRRAEFYTTGAATVQSTSLTSGSDPALYNSSGTRIADDEAGNSHWKYTTVSGTKYYAGTYGNGAAAYTISSNAPITLVRSGCPYSVAISHAAGSGVMNRAEFYTSSAATVQSAALTSGSDPALYNVSGTKIADDEAGSSHWRYTTAANTRYFAGTYGNGASKYTIYSTAPITLVRNGYNWPSILGENEGYYKIKHVQSGKYLTMSSTTTYAMSLASSSSSDYQRWRVKTVNVANKTYNIINGGDTARYLAMDTGAAIYFLGYLDGYKSKGLTSAFTCNLPKVSSSTNVYIRNSAATWALEINYYGDTAPHFYDNTLTGGWEMGEWALELIYLKGDVNMDGKITSADSDLALKAAASQVTLSSLQKFLADIDNNGTVQAIDAQKIMNMY